LELNLTGVEPVSQTNLALIHCQAAQLNTGLVQLSLSRTWANKLPLNINENHLKEVIEDLMAPDETYLNYKRYIPVNLAQLGVTKA
jgi:hypothetical protein